MSATALRTLTVEHLRGSTVPFSLTFEKNKKLTVVYGENATGKSTICDALEFLGNGVVGSLDNRGLGKTNKYWQSVGKKATDVAVSLEYMDGTACRATIVKGEVIPNPPATRPRVEVLRRVQILDLLSATAGGRYAAIQRFIDVAGVERSEATLRRLIGDMEKTRDVAVARIQENEDSIRNFWESSGKPGPNSIAWAEAEIKRDPKSWDHEITALRALQAVYLQLSEHLPRLRMAEGVLKASQEATAVAQERLDASVATVAADAGEMVHLLESARVFLGQHPDPEICPLCESAEKVDALDQRIGVRLETFASVQSAQAAATSAALHLSRSQQQLEMLRETGRTYATEFEKVRQGTAWPADVAMPTTSIPEKTEALESWLVQTAALAAKWKTAEITRYEKRQFTSTLTLQLETYATNVSAQKELDALLPRLTRALEIVVEERQKFTDDILARIAAEVGRIYELVHPGEGLDKISLELDPKKRASLEIGASFLGELGAPPQAYFSDSHLDTLGLCLFLALAALDEPKDTVLVLDDVLASVDEPHVERLIEVLYAEAIKFRHCIITTHYRPWKEKLRWGWLKNGQCQFVELSKWTSVQGMTVIRSVPDAERLRALLAETPPDPQLVCAKAGVILEASLDFLTLLYACSIPRRPGGQYTLGDLLPAINAKLRAALKVDLLSVDSAGAASYHTKSLAPILEELHRIAQARNVFGAHFNTLSFDLLDSDAIGFGTKVLELIDCLADPDAGWPKNDKSGKYWANSGETRRLHPLRQPG